MALAIWRPGGTIYKYRFLFTGREYATTYGAAFKFYEYRARAYNPTLGRFMSEDPKLFDAGDYNLFRYCHNDPIDFTDPMGLEVGFGESLIPMWGAATSLPTMRLTRGIMAWRRFISHGCNRFIWGESAWKHGSKNRPKTTGAEWFGRGMTTFIDHEATTGYRLSRQERKQRRFVRSGIEFQPLTQVGKPKVVFLRTRNLRRALRLERAFVDE